MPPAKPHPRKISAAAPEPARSTLQVVDPVWLVKALTSTLVAAVICVYATLCLLVYQGAWQFVLHPAPRIDRTPASAGLDYSPVRFGAADTGQPRLTGWWIPAGGSNLQPGIQSLPKYAAYTVLYLHGGSGSLSATIPMLTRLHQVGVNIFAIDYRGFGASDATDHPSEARMIEDSTAALDYLTSTRHIAAHNVIPTGTGLGAFLAANLAHAHPELSAVILDNPDPDPSSPAASSRLAHFLPVRWLLGKPFNVAVPIATLATPKLLIAGGPTADGKVSSNRMQSLFQQAASPRFMVTLPPGSTEGAYSDALDRFLDQYLPAR